MYDFSTYIEVHRDEDVMTWFDSSEMIEFGAAALQAVGISRADAELTARSLVVADQRGTYSHGMLRLPLYVKAIEQGGINRDASMRWISERGATALLDGDGALGQVAMQHATDRVCELAKAHGVGVVAVQGGSHFGAGSFWAEQLTRKGYLAFVTSTTGPTVAPFGGVEKVFGTNPLTMGVPAGDAEELLADMATSTGAYGKVIAARNAGEELPEGWAVAPDGQPTTDPELAMQGALTPFGGHKGSSISAALEAFASVLGASQFAYETEDIWSNPGSRMNIGQLIIAINPDFFGGKQQTETRTAGLLSTIRASAPDGKTAFAPGDPERERQREAGERVDIRPADAAALQEMADQLNVAFPAPIV